MFWREGFALNVVKKTEEEERRERIETDKLEEAKKKGKVAGTKEKLKEVARNMLAQTLPISVISQVTGFTEEEIQVLTEEKE